MTMRFDSGTVEDLDDLIGAGRDVRPREAQASPPRGHPAIVAGTVGLEIDLRHVVATAVELDEQAQVGVRVVRPTQPAPPVTRVVLGHGLRQTADRTRARKRASSSLAGATLAAAPLLEKPAHEPDAGSTGPGQLGHDGTERRHSGLTRRQAVVQGPFGPSRREHARQVHQRPGDSRTGDAVHRGHVALGQPQGSVHRRIGVATAPGTRDRDVEAPGTTEAGEIQEGGGRAVRRDGLRPGRQYDGHEPLIPRPRRPGKPVDAGSDQFPPARPKPVLHADGVKPKAVAWPRPKTPCCLPQGPPPARPCV